MRRPLVAGNWKLNGSLTRAEELAAAIADGCRDIGEVDVAVCPTFVHLAAAGSRLTGTPVALGAQDASERESGAYTGEVAARMLAELGCGYAIVGHSERRARFGESDALVGAKCRAVHEAGLTPIVCVGESLAERDDGRAVEVVSGQLRGVLDAAGERFAGAVVAYEPVWAIGTGRTATPEQAQAMHAALREALGAVDAEVASRTRIVYGGSVKSANAAELFAGDDIDGALVGGASLDADEFLAICRQATASAAN